MTVISETIRAHYIIIYI